MEKCRICLGNKKNLVSVFERDQDTSYVDMLTSIANVKIVINQRITDKICRKCRKQLREAYDFKMLIERSDTALFETNKVNIIKFNDLNDIKIKIEIDVDCKKFDTKCVDVTESFKEGIDEINYSNTVIKKLNSSCEKINGCQNAIPVLEFLKSIKTETDDDFNDNYENHNYGPETDVDDDYIPPYKLLKMAGKTKGKYKKSKVMKKKKSNNSKNESKPIRIKPVFLRDLKVLPSVTSMKNKDKTPKKQVYHARLQMCPHCGKMTKSLKSHLLTHTGDRKFKCDKCSKAFFTAANLRHHIKMHSAVRDIKCDHCVAAFSDKKSLERHMLSHSDEKKHICDICSKAFKRINALRRHRMMHNSANKSVLCDLCNMSFFTKVGLRHHMRVHTGERPYNCQICSQPYSYKHDFNRHCFKKHGVFFKRRSVYVMNEEVLKQERLLMRDLLLRVNGLINDNKPLNPFEGPQAHQAFEQTVKLLESKQIPVDF